MVDIHYGSMKRSATVRTKYPVGIFLFELASWTRNPMMILLTCIEQIVLPFDEVFCAPNWRHAIAMTAIENCLRILPPNGKAEDP